MEQNDKNKEIHIYQSDIEQVQSTKSLRFKSNIKSLDSLTAKANILGYNTIKIDEDLYAVEDANSITICSESQIKLPEDSEAMFCGTKFRSIELREVDTSDVENMTLMFSSCESTKIDFSNFDTSKVTNMHCMFGGCKVKELDLSSFNTSKVKKMDYMFDCCSLHSINLTSFDTYNVTNASYMFYNFKLAEDQELDLTSFKLKPGINTTDMFRFCHNKIRILDENVLKAFKKCNYFNKLERRNGV